MGLRDDLDAMQRHKGNGTLKEWFEGTAPPLPPEPWPSDPAATMPQNTYAWERARGD